MAVRNLPLFIALVLGWNLQPQREYLIIAGIWVLFGIVYTLTYVYPINNVLMTKAGGENTAEQIKTLTAKWIFADRFRFIIMVVGYLFLLKAFRIH